MTDAALRKHHSYFKKQVEELSRSTPSKAQKGLDYAISLIALMMVEDRLDRIGSTTTGAGGSIAATAAADRSHSRRRGPRS